MSLISVIINHYLHFYVKSLRKENGKNFLMFHVSEPDLLPVIHMKLYRIILSLTQAGSLRSNFKAEELPRLEKRV